jgi:hypothetical protein
MTGLPSFNVGSKQQGKDKVGSTTNFAITGKHTANSPMFPRTGIIKADTKTPVSNSNGSPVQGLLAPNPGLPQRMVVPLHSCKRVANRTAGPRGGSANLDNTLQLQSQRLVLSSHSKKTSIQRVTLGEQLYAPPANEWSRGHPQLLAQVTQEQSSADRQRERGLNDTPHWTSLTGSIEASPEQALELEKLRLLRLEMLEKTQEECAADTAPPPNNWIPLCPTTGSAQTLTQKDRNQAASDTHH